MTSGQVPIYISWTFHAGSHIMCSIETIFTIQSNVRKNLSVLFFRLVRLVNQSMTKSCHQFGGSRVAVQCARQSACALQSAGAVVSARDSECHVLCHAYLGPQCTPQPPRVFANKLAPLLAPSSRCDEASWSNTKKLHFRRALVSHLC